MEDNQNNNTGSSFNNNQINENPVNQEPINVEQTNETSGNLNVEQEVKVEENEPVGEEAEKKPRKGFGVLITMLIIVVIAVLGIIVYEKVINKKTKVVTYSIVFDADGGKPETTSEVESGKPVTKPTDPEKEGYKFVEWQLNGQKYDFNTPITADLTLKALWEKNEESKIVEFDEEPLPPEELKKDEESEKNEKYFTVKSISKTVDGKKINIDFRFYVDYYVLSKDENSECEDGCTSVVYDIYVNDRKLDSILFDDFVGDYRTDLNYLYGKGTINPSWIGHGDYIESVIEEIDKTGVIVVKDAATGKEYLYIHKGKPTNSSSYAHIEKLWILDSNLNLLSRNSEVNNKNKVITKDYYAIAGGEEIFIETPSDCDERFKLHNTDYIYPVYDGLDGVHYLDSNYWDEEMSLLKDGYTASEDLQDVIAEFVINVNNGKVQKTKVKSCFAAIGGQR